MYSGSNTTPDAPAAPVSVWRSSPLGHSYRKFESEWNAHTGNLSQAHDFGVPEKAGAQARVIWFIERCRQLEKKCKTLENSLEEKAKAERRHNGDMSDLRGLINDLCAKVRKVERERDSAVKEKDRLVLETTKMKSRLETALQDTKKYRSNDARLHTMVVDCNRALQEEKLRVEGLEDELDNERRRAETAESDAVAQVAEIEERTAKAVDAANHRAEEILEELKGIQGGWQEMKKLADSAADREQAALRQTEARISIAESAAKTAQAKAREATEKQVAVSRIAGSLRARVDKLESQLQSRIGELEAMRSESAKSKAEKALLNQQIVELRAALQQKERALRDGSRQRRVQHIKFVDARLRSRREQQEARVKSQDKGIHDKKPKRKSVTGSKK